MNKSNNSKDSVLTVDEKQLLKRLYQKNRDRMFSYCLYISGDRQLSEDVIHDLKRKFVQNNKPIGIANRKRFSDEAFQVLGEKIFADIEPDFHLTDSGNAKRMVNHFGHLFRYNFSPFRKIW